MCSSWDNVRQRRRRHTRLLQSSRTLSANVVLCTPKSYVALEDDGSLVVSKPGGAYRDNILIDLESSVVRQPPNGEPETFWKVVQKGNYENDWILVLKPPLLRSHREPSELENLIRTTSNVIRVRHWNGMKQIVFFQLSQASSLSGTCVTVK